MLHWDQAWKFRLIYDFKTDVNAYTNDRLKLPQTCNASHPPFFYIINNVGLLDLSINLLITSIYFLLVSLILKQKKC